MSAEGEQADSVQPVQDRAIPKPSSSITEFLKSDFCEAQHS